MASHVLVNITLALWEKHSYDLQGLLTAVVKMENFRSPCT